MMLVSHFVGPGGATGVLAGGLSHDGGSRVRWARDLSSRIAEGLVYSPGKSKTVAGLDLGRSKKVMFGLCTVKSFGGLNGEII